MVGQEWRQLLALTGLVLSALMFAVGVVRSQLVLALSGFVLLGVTLAVWLQGEGAPWATDVLTLFILLMIFLLVVVLTRDSD
jgi:hypothetical protein